MYGLRCVPRPVRTKKRAAPVKGSSHFTVCAARYAAIARFVPIKEPAFVQEFDLAAILFVECPHQLIAKPLGQGYLLLLRFHLYVSICGYSLTRAE